MAVKDIDESDEADERINRIEEYLWKLPSDQSMKCLVEFPPELRKYGVIDSTISISSVIDFLKADGNKFVFSESNYKTQRPRWKVFNNAYFSWYFKKEPSTLNQYQKKAKKQEVTEQSYKPNFFGRLSRVNVISLLKDIFSRPLVNYCPPIECSDRKANSHRFAELIDQTDTK